MLPLLCGIFRALGINQKTTLVYLVVFLPLVGRFRLLTSMGLLRSETKLCVPDHKEHICTRSLSKSRLLAIGWHDALLVSFLILKLSTFEVFRKRHQPFSLVRVVIYSSEFQFFDVLSAFDWNFQVRSLSYERGWLNNFLVQNQSGVMTVFWSNNGWPVKMTQVVESTTGKIFISAI